MQIFSRYENIKFNWYKNMCFYSTEFLQQMIEEVISFSKLQGFVQDLSSFIMNYITQQTGALSCNGISYNKYIFQGLKNKKKPQLVLHYAFEETYFKFFFMLPCFLISSNSQKTKVKSKLGRIL